MQFCTHSIRLLTFVESQIHRAWCNSCRYPFFITAFLQPCSSSCTNCRTLILRCSASFAVSFINVEKVPLSPPKGAVLLLLLQAVIGLKTCLVSGLSGQYCCGSSGCGSISNLGRLFDRGCSSCCSVILASPVVDTSIDGLAHVDGITSTFDAISSTLSFHALLRGLGYTACSVSFVR